MPVESKTGSFSFVLVPRNCARCGQNFGALGREYVCPTCREPKRKTVVSRDLSFREKQIVELVRQAKANKEIAYELCLTVGTVKEYLYHIFRKIGVRNRTELALWAENLLTASELSDRMVCNVDSQTGDSMVLGGSP